jgi:hypothetical protein
MLGLTSSDKVTFFAELDQNWRGMLDLICDYLPALGALDNPNQLDNTHKDPNIHDNRTIQQ